MQVANIQIRTNILDISNAETQGLGGQSLNYDKNGGNQSSAWGKSRGGWGSYDDEE